MPIGHSVIHEIEAASRAEGDIQHAPCCGGVFEINLERGAIWKEEVLSVLLRFRFRVA